MPVERSWSGSPARGASKIGGLGDKGRSGKSPSGSRAAARLTDYRAQEGVKVKLTMLPYLPKEGSHYGPADRPWPG